MAPITSLIRGLLDTEAERVVYECRDCGTSVDEAVEICPNCDSESIASHRLD